ncbi:hypothetical protein B0H13DRAFT_2290268 [Mycena leptocephala]|nr:hypothetical protein B0H13DRAFT_2290268 [Mycena leptocephala]
MFALTIQAQLDQLASKLNSSNFLWDNFGECNFGKRQLRKVATPKSRNFEKYSFGRKDFNLLTSPLAHSRRTPCMQAQGNLELLGKQCDQYVIPYRGGQKLLEVNKDLAVNNQSYCIDAPKPLPDVVNRDMDILCFQMVQNNNTAGKRMLEADFGNSLIDIHKGMAPRLANNYFKLVQFVHIRAQDREFLGLINESNGSMSAETKFRPGNN